MADAGAVPPTPIDPLFAAWRSSFDGIAEEVDGSWAALAQRLQDADSDETYATALGELAWVRSRGERALSSVADLIRSVEALNADWHAGRRYQRDVLERRAADIGELVRDDPEGGAEEWLSELFDALDVAEWDAVMLLARGLDWPPPLARGARHVADGLKRWNDGDHEAGLELMQRLGEGRLEGWTDVLDPALRSRAHRLAAWVALRRLKRTELAEQLLGAALEIWPYAGRMHAERAAYFLSIGDLDRAATDAQRSVELAQDDAAGYLELGIWAELSGDFEDADQFYRKTLALLPTYDIVRLATRISIMDPPGRLLTRAAEMLLAKKRPRDALRVVEQALHADQRGPEPHPQAAALRARCRALQEMTDHSPREAAVAAIEAGKLYAYNGDVKAAIELFERAEELDGGLEDVGWLLADARLTTSLPLGATTTDQTVVAQARETWERWADKVGPPRARSSWAYLTRAEIADLSTQQPEANRLAGIWEALQYVEKAILHDSVDAQRWGYAAQYLRHVHLDELALEAVERGYELSSGERKVLAERLAQLMFRGRFVEADRVAEDLVTMFGNDPWVSAARAWLAIHSDLPTRYRDGLLLLELPIAGGNDPSWYYEMRALCHAGLGQIGMARAAYRDLLSRALAVDGTTKCRRAVAAGAAGEVERAAHWSAEAWNDPTSRPVTCLTTDAFLAFACGDPDAGVELLGRAIERSASVVELHDVVELTLLRLRLLDDSGTLAAARERVAALAARAVRERERSLASHPITADQELADALAASESDEDAPPIVRETLLAVKARREAQAGRLREAAASYEELLGTAFETEATRGLTRALRALAKQQAAAGEVDEVKALWERISALGSVSRSDVATTVASALEHSGSRRQAREQLENAIETAGDDRERAKLRLRAGGLALADDDLDEASVHFQVALEIARQSDAHARAGQAQIRMALIGVRRGDPDAARLHLIAAARAWKDAGAVDPTAVLMSELRGLRRLRGGRWEAAAGEALELVEAAVAEGTAPDELGPLRRELGMG